MPMTMIAAASMRMGFRVSTCLERLQSGDLLGSTAVHRAQQLGRYHLLDRIAFGGMAEIFRARTFDAEGHQHMVAVKRILGHLAADEDFIQMLIDEAKIASHLEHENIAQIYELARAHDEYYIAMEYVDGK